MVVHADYTQPCYKVYPNFKHPKLKRVIAITKYIQRTLKEKFDVDAELCYNPIVLEPKEKRITLVSATRLSPIKGGDRMRMLAEEMDAQKLNYIWYVFTSDDDRIHSDNVIFMRERLDVYKWIQEADLVVQVSDTEADSYTIKEARGYGTMVLVTPLPYLEEAGIKNNDNAIILDFNCSNIKEVVEKIKTAHRTTSFVLRDDYKKYLTRSESKYEERMTRNEKNQSKTEILRHETQ